MHNILKIFTIFLTLGFAGLAAGQTSEQEADTGEIVVTGRKENIVNLNSGGGSGFTVIWGGGSFVMNITNSPQEVVLIDKNGYGVWVNSTPNGDGTATVTEDRFYSPANDSRVNGTGIEPRTLENEP